MLSWLGVPAVPCVPRPRPGAPPGPVCPFDATASRRALEGRRASAACRIAGARHGAMGCHGLAFLLCRTSRARGRAPLQGLRVHPTRLPPDERWRGGGPPPRAGSPGQSMLSWLGVPAVPCVPRPRPGAPPGPVCPFDATASRRALEGRRASAACRIAGASHAAVAGCLAHANPCSSDGLRGLYPSRAGGCSASVSANALGRKKNARNHATPVATHAAAPMPKSVLWTCRPK